MWSQARRILVSNLQPALSAKAKFALPRKSPAVLRTALRLSAQIARNSALIGASSAARDQSCSPAAAAIRQASRSVGRGSRGLKFTAAARHPVGEHRAWVACHVQGPEVGLLEYQQEEAAGIAPADFPPVALAPNAGDVRPRESVAISGRIVLVCARRPE